MRNFILATAAAFALAAAPAAFAQAHNHGGHAAGPQSVQTTPADGAMGAPPSAFSATFEHPMRLSTLVVTPQRGDPIAVTVPASEAATTVSVALPRLAPGNYTIVWTATGGDNHNMTGRVRYMVH